MSKQGDPRGTGTTPPKWWLDLFVAARKYRAQSRTTQPGCEVTICPTRPYPETTIALADLLSEIASRTPKWDRGVVSRFINGDLYTREMADAFCVLYGLPRYEILFCGQRRGRR